MKVKSTLLDNRNNYKNLLLLLFFITVSIMSKVNTFICY